MKSLLPDSDDRNPRSNALPLPGLGQELFREKRREHWEGVAGRGRLGWGGAYHARLTAVMRLMVPRGLRVLEVGCGQGDLLAALEPSLGVGIDLSPSMVDQARSRHPRLHLFVGDAHEIAGPELLQQVSEVASQSSAGGSTDRVCRDGTFDVIVLSDLLNDVYDVQAILEALQAVSGPRTRLLVSIYSHLWEVPLRLAQRLGLARPTLQQNWLTTADLDNLLHLAGWRSLVRRQEVLLPLPMPGLAGLANRVLTRMPLLRHLSLCNVVVARPELAVGTPPREPLVSVIVPARNEAGNVAAIFDRTPELGAGTELIFVEGHSTDDTYATIERELALRPERKAKLLRQTGKGKGDAVRAGFAAAHGDILLILDADLTVAPEDLPRFVAVLASGRGEFANGVRLVYPMEKRAMRFANLLGNKFFSLAFSWLLDQPIKDTLCGTKVMWRDDYERLAAQRAYFGEFDPFGDYDLLFGAAKLRLEIVDVPIRYRERTYGTTNIQRWRHGLLLLRMCVFAAGRLKLV